MQQTSNQLYARFYKVIRRIPRGRVATYGQVAILAGAPRNARYVGRALRNLRDQTDVPWQRVVNARGEISPRARSDDHELQRILLEAEGIVFTTGGRIDLKRYGWSAREPRMRPVRISRR